MSPLKPKGQWFAYLYGPDGKLKETRQGYNVVTSVGKEFIASYLNSAVVAAATFTGKYIAIGTGSTTESASDTGMGTEASRSTGTCSYISNQIFQIKTTFATGSGTGAIAEYGLFSSATGGTLIARDTEAVINKGANDTLTVVYQMTIS